ncbi:MAG: hypothetical protein LBQ46_12570, partial [Treponema sp.]|nr:hypothetical protein [Treponema sp.]
ESSSGRKITWPDGKIAAEVDIFLENTEYCLAVEVKSKLLERHVDEHLKRLEIIKRYYTEIKHDGHSFLGAVAGAIMDEGVRNYAIKAGFYVITQTGDTVKIDVPPDFVPRKW